jgi:hypothetical protein
MRKQAQRLGALVVLSASSCRSSEVGPRELPQATVVVETASEPARAPQPEPPPPPEPEPEPAPEPAPPVWQPNAKPAYIQAERLSGTAKGARYSLKSDQLHYRVNLRVRDELTTVTLTELDSGHELQHEWPNTVCSFQFYDGNSAGAALAEIAHDERGRKLLELWVSCQFGEDIRQLDSVVLVVLADAGGLSPLWSGNTSSHSSHVCSKWNEFDLKLEQRELVITQTDRGAIFEPETLPYYDCENAREYETVRDRQRIALP